MSYSKNINLRAVAKKRDTRKKDEPEKEIEQEEMFDKEIEFSTMGLSPEVLKAIAVLGFKHPTTIQRKSLPYTLKGRDVIGLAETGSGKTLAFLLPMIEALLENPQPYFGLVIAPTRELCLQINEHCQALGQGIGLKSNVIVGGLDLMAQSVSLIQQKPHIIICTPGRILHHLENTKGFSLQNLKYLVMDEADKLLTMDFEKQLDSILEALPKKRISMLFSATMTNKVSKLQRASLNDPVKVEVSTKFQTARNLKQYMIFIAQKFKDVYLVNFMTQFAGKTVLIFVLTCKQALRTCLLLRNLGFDVGTIHGQMSQVKRIGSLNKFKTKERKILVATDVASRGLDIPNVDLVINFDIPQSFKDYIHRVGRTARAGKSGTAVSIVNQYDVFDYQKIEHNIKKKLDVYPVNEADVLVFQERVHEAQRIAEHELKELIKDKVGSLKNLKGNSKKKKRTMKKKLKFDVQF